MPHYCVSTVALATGEHIVHRLGDTCSLLPDAEHRCDLGPLSDDNTALREAARKFGSIDGCPECIADLNDHATEDAINAAVAAVITVSNM